MSLQLAVVKKIGDNLPPYPQLKVFFRFIQVRCIKVTCLICLADSGASVFSENAQSKIVTNGAVNQTTLTTSTTSSSTSSPIQSAAKQKSTSATAVDNTRLPTNEFYIPVFDLKRQDVLKQLELIGIDQFIPASNLTSMSQHVNYAIPILSTASLQRVSNTGFPTLSGVVNLGTSKSSSSKQD